MPHKKNNTGNKQLNSETRAGSNQNPDAKSIPLKRILVPLLLIIAVIVFIFWIYLFNRRSFVSTNDAYIDADRVSISAKLLGRIDQLMVDEGDTVHTGQVLVKLDDSSLQAQEVQARASLELAQENIALARVNLKRAEEDYNRAGVQYRGGVISKEKFDHVQSDYEAAGIKTRISKAQAQTAAAQLGIIETQLNNTTLTSPMNGVVSKRWVITGDIVQPGQAIFSIYDLKNIWITANLEETRLAVIHEGNPVTIKVDSYPHLEFTGKIVRIGSNTAAQFSLLPPNNASGNFTKITQRVPITISIERPPGSVPVRLLPGMSVNIKVKVR